MTSRRTVLVAGASLLLPLAPAARAACRTAALSATRDAASCIVLDIHGPKRRPDGVPLASLTLAQLQALPQTTIQTSLPHALHAVRRAVWEGPSLSDVLAEQGLQAAQSVYVESLSGYGADLPSEDLRAYSPILAWRRNGQALAVRNNGPLIVIYPFDSHPALRGDIRYLQRIVWQVQALTVH
ncbi:hypothetical protein BRI6_2661 [plant metagenome]|uniref:Oxidoreductase molybdopterin-binding domain-containing protein n=1 Tax=plant metagenome TaxID=1297885 RepID=A0A484XR02_9ZZZZ